jgi:hypothetical protein
MDTTWLTKMLPPRQAILRRSEADYYGASDLIACALGYATQPRSVASWMHAVSYERRLDFPELLFPEGNRATRHLVATSGQVQQLTDRGFLRVHATGVPFLYVEPSATTRIPGSLLVMPAHSVANSTHSFDEEGYADQISAVRNRFDVVLASVSFPCTLKGMWTRALERREIPWIVGADSTDKNALRRMAKMFASFEYMTTNALGSHVAYAAFSGCKVSIWGPYANYQLEDFKELAWYKKNWRKAPQVIQNMSEQHVRNRHPMLFRDPWRAESMVEWAGYLLGLQHKRSPLELAQLLGWTALGQIEARLHRAARRCAEMSQAAARRLCRLGVKPS